MQKLIKNLNVIWNRFKKPDPEFFNEVEEQLILNDVTYNTAEIIINDLKKYCQKENIVDVEKIKILLKEKINAILAENNPAIPGQDFLSAENLPAVWMLVGVNGVGKTSTTAKLANYFKKKGKTVLLTAADTYRAAAYEQINHFAELLNIPIVHHQRHSDPGAVVFDSIEKAIAKEIDVILIDTAGRMHTAYNLMEELKKIKKVVQKKIGRKPDEILMVIDTTTGQNSTNQAKIFHEALDLTGFILTKTDGTSKGGSIISIKNDTGVPVKFITFGEKLENIETFDPVKFSDMMFS